MAIVGYKLRINGGDLTNHIIDAGLVYEYEITGLDPGTTYLVELASYDESAVLAPWSVAVECTTRILSLVVSPAGTALVDADDNAIMALN